MTKDDSLIITDVSVCWESPEPLNMAYAVKRAIYSTPTFLEKVEELYPGKEIKVLPLIVGARGGWCSDNQNIIQTIGATDAEVGDIIHTAIRGSCVIHKQFSREVWRSARRVRT